MNDARAFARQVMEQLAAVATAQRREGMERYFTTSMRCIGVTVPDSRKVVKASLKELKPRSKAFVLDVVRGLIAEHALEARAVAYEILAGHKTTMETITVAELEELGAGNDNWGTTDAFGCLVTGALWRDGRLEDETLLRWAKSDDLWWRRTAVVSSTELNKKTRGGKGDFPRTLALVDLVGHEKHPMIAKAVSWALRQLVPWDKERVGRYLDEHESTLPALVRREVRKKIETGVKNPGRQGRQP
jgi:3-methyladenine DNA glycosylase AlkD